MKKLMSLVIALAMVLTLSATPTFAATNNTTGIVVAPQIDVNKTTASGTDYYGNTWSQVKIKDGVVLIKGYYMHDAVIDFNIGSVEYRGIRMYLATEQNLIKQVGWMQAVLTKANSLLDVIDMNEKWGGDWYFNYCKTRCTTPKYLK